MRAFFSYSHEDTETIEAIASWLSKKELDIWVDHWQLTPGDSLIERVSEGIETSDKLLVFLSPNSVNSNWVRKEVASGLILELAEEKGYGSKFVIPVLLIPCKVPIFLRDKVYADFSNKAFDSACEELLRGIKDEPKGIQDKKLQNGFVRTYTVEPINQGKYAMIVEFGVSVSPTEGLHVGIDTGVKYTHIDQWFGLPNTPTIPSSRGGVFYNSAVRQEPPIYARKFSSPGISSTKSYYWYFESNEPFSLKEIQFLDYYDRPV